MAVEVNDSKVEVTNERKLYTGLCNFSIVAINPNQAELVAMGIRAQKEPVYVTDGEANGESFKKVRLDFYISNGIAPKINTKLAIFLESRKRVNKGGDKNEYINKFAQSCWSTIGVSPTYEWFKKDGLHVAYSGEVQLHDFIQAWANVGVDKACQLDTMDAIVKGDITELKGMVVALKQNLVKLLLGVTEGDKGERYQAVYTGHFGRSYQGNLGFVKALEAKGQEFKADYQNSLDLRLYVPTVSTPSPSGTATPATTAAPAQAAISF